MARTNITQDEFKSIKKLAGPRLLLEEIGKRLPSVPRSAGGGFAFDDRARDEEIAGVAGVLVYDLYRDGLAALEAGARIEVRTLPAGVEIGFALLAR